VSVAPGSFELDLGLWEPWTPAEVAGRLEGVDATWYVLAGWALDLFQGRQTREHEDLEIGVAGDEFGAILEALADLELFVVGDGRAWPPTQAALKAHRQTWAREPRSGLWRIDVIREQWDEGVWVYRHDPRIRIPGADLVARTSDGIPYIRPEVALLFKSRQARPKDEKDFAAVLPLLDLERRAWLAETLAVVDPGHPWRRSLARD
jgi:aminoglycoside-2''-adenylyltransferase